MPEFLPFALPLIGDEEVGEVVDCLRSGWLTSGERVKRFEKEFSRFIGVEHALAVSSATAGLHLALEAIGIEPGDRVITTPYTFTATAEVVRYLGADPVFVDVDPRTFNIDPELVEAALERDDRIKAILPVHFGGQACDMDPLLSLAKDHGITVVEDAAHALPSTYKGRLVGQLGDVTVYSFYVTKTLVTGEGGMVVTKNAGYADRIQVMRLHGINNDVFDRYTSEKPSWYYEVVAPGFKYNMTDLAAAIGIHQLNKLELFHGRRERIARRYDTAFTDLPFQTPFVARSDDTHAWHLYVILLELDRLNINRDRFIELMSEAGIGTSVHFIPLHVQPYWRDRYELQPDDFPVSSDIYRRAVSLPIYPRMTDDDIERVIAAVTGIASEHAR
ncbi:DegT/DnrJ/EryC1/StrS family aminotransferase [Gemmatimonadota bacterium]